MITIGKGGQRRVEDFHLSRYACYLIIQNADLEEEIVALGQTYFALQKRRQEFSDAAQGLDHLSENQKRIVLRDELATHNTKLKVLASSHQAALLFFRITDTADYMVGFGQKIFMSAKGSSARSIFLII
ncbi:MAG: hypothetical protein MI924_01780 [Chloroflexales bacterium]|nr:hypothetical protein [Chloroflexales bacterium]